MTTQTIKHQYAEQTAQELANKSCIEDAVVDENHKGVYVRVMTDTYADYCEAYNMVNKYEIWITVEQTNND